MKKCNVVKMFLTFLAVLAVLFAGCKGISLDSGDGGTEYSTEYGSLSIAKDINRSMDVSEIDKVKVTVSGVGISTPLTAESAASNGKADVTVERIPVGKNRVVAMQAYKGTDIIDGAVMYAVTDIKSGANTVAVNWTTSKRGKVYNALLAKSVDISSLTDTDKADLEAAIPSDTHSVLIDAESIANDYKTQTLKSAENYILKHGTVSVSAKKVSGYTVQVTDIASKLKKVSAPSEDFDLAACPGNRKVRVLDASGNVVAEEDISIQSGASTDVHITDTSNFAGKTIIFVKASSAPQIWAWEDKGVELSKKAGGVWGNSSVATTLVPATTEYMAEPSGWYMIDYTKYATGKLIKFKLNWSGSGITGKAGTFWYDGTSTPSVSSENPSPAPSVIKITVGEPEIPPAPFKIYVSADSAPDIWAWSNSSPNVTSAAQYPGVKMLPAAGLKNNSDWYETTLVPKKLKVGEEIKFILNGDGTPIESHKSITFWYDAKGVSGAAGAFYDADPTTPPVPVAPTVSITPATGKSVPLNGAITVKLSNGNSVITAANVTISGDVSKTYAYADFTDDVLTIPVKSLGAAQGNNITVTANVTNSEGTASDTSVLTIAAESTDFFTWDNVNAYFVLTDRFANGDTSNDHSYYRKNDLSGDENVATFHGGDIKGLTDNIDYFKKLGVNAIWITAPYEQVHGWVSGKGMKFPHYAFHGYYALDWTYMDRNMGTVEEFRTFVQTCHRNGIRVVMDIVMNHVGYNNTEDMITYNHGQTSHTEHGWLEKVEGVWNANDTVAWTNNLWDSWWGPWIRSFGYASGTEYGGSCGGLPDVKSELPASVGLAPVLVTKWSQETSSDYDAYKVPAVANVDWYSKTGNWRTDQNVPPVQYQIIWLSSWVREFGIDGFRCDTAKHVEPKYWGQLKDACQSALEAWRNDSTKADDSGAKDWDENFWMTGEYWGWTSIAGSGEYYTTGKFDSMINFSFNGGNAWDGNYRTNYPKPENWGSYLSINNNADSDGNGNRNNVLSYISSHDTALTRVSDMKDVGTGLVLLPGGVQIYYGDESNRQKAYAGCGDGDMMTRGDMNLAEAKTSELTAHWGKLGTFRKFNPAVGAGTGSKYKRSYTGAAGSNKVAIGITGTSVDVSGLFTDGATVYNWYDGTSSAVSGGKVTFAGGTSSQPILVSDRNPADCGVTF